MKSTISAVAGVVLVLAVSAVASRQSDRERLNRIEQTLKSDVPRILCVDERVATAGQPTDTAFGKLAENGFRSVLNLRTSSEGIDLEREKSLVEAAGLRYVNIPVVSSAPKPEQVDAFIKAVKDPANHPMLIHCGGANRVGGFWMIYRVVEQNWSEEKALEEATRIGLSSPTMKTFALEQIGNRKK